jgi:hypothetical protein
VVFTEVAGIYPGYDRFGQSIGIYMLKLEFIHLILLAILLMPGIVAGWIVSWKIRSPLALFFTIGSSLASPFSVSLLGMLIWKIFSPFILPTQSGVHPLFDEVAISLPYLFMIPTGLVAGAILAGMLLVAKHELKSNGGIINFSYVATAGISSSIFGSILSLILMLVTSSVSKILLSLFIKLFHPNIELGLVGVYLLFYGFIGLFALVGTMVCGFMSALGGLKLAKSIC